LRPFFALFAVEVFRSSAPEKSFLTAKFAENSREVRKEIQIEAEKYVVVWFDF
jgi:hypothetical protein